jgi:hypothetical protein
MHLVLTISKNDQLFVQTQYTDTFAAPELVDNSPQSPLFQLKPNGTMYALFQKKISHITHPKMAIFATFPSIFSHSFHLETRKNQ